MTRFPSVFRMLTDSIWRDRSFVLFWLADLISLAGTTITNVVLRSWYSALPARPSKPHCCLHS